jgi:hypothetical protein
MGVTLPKTEEQIKQEVEEMLKPENLKIEYAEKFE